MFESNLLRFEEYEDHLYEFERIVTENCGIDIPGQADYFSIADHILELLSAYKAEIQHDPKVDVRQAWRKAIGLIDIINNIIDSECNNEFTSLCNHIELLFGNTGIVQNDWSTVSDQNSNKIFELYIALILMKICTNIDLDNPIHSTGDNPDILASFNGTRWGFACKTIHSTNPRSYLDNIITAIEQIENSEAERGIVLINMKNIINHNEFWPIMEVEEETEEIIYTTFSNRKNRSVALIENANPIFDQLPTICNGIVNMPQFFEEKKAVPVVLNFYSSLVGMFKDSKPILTLFRQFQGYPFGHTSIDNLDINGRTLINKMNDSLHRVLSAT